MITEKALFRTKVIIFAEKHGIDMALEAFNVKRRTFFNWKKAFNQGGKKAEALSEKKTTPKTKRKRVWSFEVREKIKSLRTDHPNLGPEKIHPILQSFCNDNGLKCPKTRTIARIIEDAPDKMRRFPEKTSHFGVIKKTTRKKVLRKPKGLIPQYPGHLVALDTIERIVNGNRRYIITFEDIYTRFSFAWSTRSHASKAAEEFFDLCLKVFPYSFKFLYVLTDNGSEFKKHFNERLMELHLVHYHTYPRTPKMNAHVERFNRTIQEEFIDYFSYLLIHPDDFNRRLIDYLTFYNIDRVHHAFQNKLSPVQYMMRWQERALASVTPASQIINKSSLMLQECQTGWHYTKV